VNEIGSVSAGRVSKPFKETGENQAGLVDIFINFCYEPAVKKMNLNNIN